MSRLYNQKLTDAATAVSKIKDGGMVYVAGNAATPRALVNALAARTDIHRPITVAHALLLGQDPFTEARNEDRFRHLAWFVGPADRPAVNDGRADAASVHLHQLPRVITEGPPVHGCLLNVSPPDEHGFMSLGIEVMAARAAINKADHVVVQVNESMPRIHGDAFVHASEVDAIVEHDEDIPELIPPPPTTEQQAIARHIAPMVPDGATLQLGIGGVPDAVLRLLCDPDSGMSRRDLGIHSEMVSDGLIDAVHNGFVTGRAKTLHPGKVILTFAMGSRKLYDFIADNPLCEAHPCDHVNDPFVIAQNDKMVAINSALSVDLTGQVNSDSIGTRIYSGFGGQVDFIRGAAASKGGVPVIALPSTARGGTMSRIVPELLLGAGVVTSRADVHWVVTEHGAVNLFGRNLRDRAALLISIAAPQFRDQLTAAAKARHLL